MRIKSEILDIILMNITIKIAGVDVSSHVISCGSIPIVKRNRDWQIVTDGFSVEVSKIYTTPIIKGSTVEVFIDGSPVYLGSVLTCKKGADNLSYNVEVTHKLIQLEAKLSQYNNLHTLLNDTSVGTAGVNYSVDVANNYIVKAAHGLALGDRIQFKSDGGGTLAGGLEYGHYYWVSVIDSNHFKIYANHGDWIIPNPCVDITSAGVGTTYYSKVTGTELNKYADWSNINYQPTFSLAWLVKKLFQIIGCTLDTSNMDSLAVWSLVTGSTTTLYTWDKLVMSEDMLYCLNQDKANNHIKLDADDTTEYKRNKLTCLALLRLFCGTFGINFRYMGNNVFKIYSQKRHSTTGWSDVTHEDLYNISDSDKLEYESYTIDGDKNGWIRSRKYAPVANYSSEFYEFELTEDGIASTNDGNTTLTYVNSLRFFLRSATPGEVLAVTSYQYEYPIDQVLDNATNALIFNYQYERIVAPINLTIFTVKELNINVDNQTMEIIQERNNMETN
jgi:hypothetical protein